MEKRTHQLLFLFLNLQNLSMMPEQVAAKSSPQPSSSRAVLARDGGCIHLNDISEMGGIAFQKPHTFMSFLFLTTHPK